MKILLVNDVPVTGGHGTENHVSMLAGALSLHGHAVRILTGQHRGEPPEATGTTLAIPDLAAPLIRKRQMRHLKSMEKAISEMCGYVSSFRPDVIHVHNMLNPFTIGALHRFGPIVKSVHDCRPFCAKPPWGNVASRLVGSSDEFCSRVFGAGCLPRCYLSASPKELLEGGGAFLHNLLALRRVRQCEAIVVYSEYLRQLAIQAGCDEERINVIHLFTDLQSDNREQLFPRNPTVVFAGFLALEKGVMNLLEAVRMIPEPFDVTIIGDGPLAAEARTRGAAIQGKRIRFTGYLPQEEVLRHMRSCTLVVFPSIGSEGCGMVGLEAMAHGKPVVGYDTGGVSEWLVHGETGYLAPRGDVEKLAAGIRALLRDEGTARRLGRTGRELVATKFRKDLHVGRILGVYAQAIRDRQAMPFCTIGMSGGHTV